MATIRVLTEDDLPAVTELFGRVYSERHWISPAACESYFREMLFDNPWRDLQIPSWVAEQHGLAMTKLILPQLGHVVGLVRG